MKTTGNTESSHENKYVAMQVERGETCVTGHNFSLSLLSLAKVEETPRPNKMPRLAADEEEEHLRTKEFPAQGQQ